MSKDKSGTSNDTPAPVSNTKIIYRRKREEIFGIDSNTVQMALGVGGLILGGLAFLNSNKKNEELQLLSPQSQPEGQGQQLPENQLESAISYQTQAQPDTPQLQSPADFTTDSVRKEVIDRYKGTGNQPIFSKRMSIA